MRGLSDGLAGRLVHTAMHLGFVLERRWAPYPKWLGTLFTTLPSAGLAAPALQAALSATTWQERQDRLCEALVRLHDLQRSIELPVSGEVLEAFFDRPFRGVRATVVESLLSSVTDPQVLRLPAGVGSVEQWVEAAHQRRNTVVSGRPSPAQRPAVCAVPLVPSPGGSAGATKSPPSGCDGRGLVSPGWLGVPAGWVSPLTGRSGRTAG